VTAYYNEIDPYAAEWLRNLIVMGHIAHGVVDERSIEDVTPYELREFTQCHFFAGVGVWSFALRNAGWPDDKPIWTGSCPCQPFSTAGKGIGFTDERHLWPHWNWLISECKPSAVFGEQVASKTAEPWIDLVQTDLETLGYAFGAVAFPSASIGAPHIRDRTYWVGHTNDQGSQGYTRYGGIEGREGTGGSVTSTGISDGCEAGAGRVRSPGPINGFWRNADWLSGVDGVWRPVEPGTFPLVNGASSRVGRLCAYGNAINAEQAKVFIETVMVSVRP
jgi:DNA (cytosine-5)-methyltransferase 1